MITIGEFPIGEFPIREFPIREFPIREFPIRDSADTVRRPPVAPDATRVPPPRHSTPVPASDPRPVQPRLPDTFLPEAGIDVPSYERLSVEPLQGLYQKSDPTRNWTLLIAVPDFVTDERVHLARAEMRCKHKEVDADVRLADREQGDVIQTLRLVRTATSRHSNEQTHGRAHPAIS